MRAWSCFRIWAALALAMAPLPSHSIVIDWTCPAPPDSFSPATLPEFPRIFPLSDGFLLSSPSYGNGILLSRYDDKGKLVWSRNSSTSLLDQPHLKGADAVVETSTGLVVSGDYPDSIYTGDTPNALVLLTEDGREKAEVFPHGRWAPTANGDFYSLIPPNATSPWPFDIGIQRLGFGPGPHWQTRLGTCDWTDLIVNRSGTGPIVGCYTPNPTGPVDTLVLWSLDTAGTVTRTSHVPVGRNTWTIRGHHLIAWSTEALYRPGKGLLLAGTEPWDPIDPGTYSEDSLVLLSLDTNLNLVWEHAYPLGQATLGGYGGGHPIRVVAGPGMAFQAQVSLLRFVNKRQYAQSWIRNFSPEGLPAGPIRMSPPYPEGESISFDTLSQSFTGISNIWDSLGGPGAYETPVAVALAYPVVTYAASGAEEWSRIPLPQFRDTVWRTDHWTPLGVVTSFSDYPHVDDIQFTPDGGVVLVGKLYLHEDQGTHPLAAIKLKPGFADAVVPKAGRGPKVSGRAGRNGLFDVAGRRKTGNRRSAVPVFPGG